jgi:hypothetical protein
MTTTTPLATRLLVFDFFVVAFASVACAPSAEGDEEGVPEVGCSLGCSSFSRPSPA